MFKLRLRVKDCVSCGVCMDVCPPRAISMRSRSPRSVEGQHMALLNLPKSDPWQPDRLMTYPYLAQDELCDGCALCVRECPGEALDLQIAERLPTSQMAPVETFLSLEPDC